MSKRRGWTFWIVVLFVCAVVAWCTANAFPLAKRNDIVFKVLGSNFAPGSSYLINVLPPGAEVASGSSGTTITVRQGHGFVAGQKLIKGFDLATYRTVSSTTTTTVVVSSALTVVLGDTLYNLGNDSGALSPSFDSTTIPIYQDMQGITAYSPSKVTSDSQGRYGYWYSASDLWEIFRNSGGFIVGATKQAVPKLAPSSVGLSNVSGTGVYIHPDTQGTDFPRQFPGVGAGFGITFDKLSTTSGSLGIYYAHDGLIRWSLGEDYYVGAAYNNADRSYFALLGDKVYGGSGSWASGDFLVTSWGGAETSMVGNVPRVTGQPGVDGPKFIFNGSFVPSADPQTYSGPFQYTFNVPTLQTGLGAGMYAAIFQSALYGTGTLVDFDSGGVQINVSRQRAGLTIINQSLTQNTRKAFIAAGRGGTNGFLFGVDIPNNDTQNWSVYDLAAAAYRLYIPPTGGLWINEPAGSQFVTATLTQNATTGMQINNNSTGTAAYADLIAGASGTKFANLAAFSTGYTGDATLAGHTMLFSSGTGAKLNFGTAGTKRMTLLDSAAKLGIGVDPPTEALDVVGNIKATGDLLPAGAVIPGTCADTASATTITADSCNMVTITGSTAIVTINTCNAANKGRVLRVLCGTATATITDGSNLKMAGNLVCTADDSIGFICDGTNWIEISRSVN